MYRTMLSVARLCRRTWRPFSSGAGDPSFRFADLEVELTTEPKEKPATDSLIFGSQFSDHMLSVRHVRGRGWDRPRIHPLRSFQLHPGAKALNYALECFEGMKAYYGADGRVRLFRPMENMRRLCRSAERATLATFDPEELAKCLRQLLRIDLDWVPKSQQCSLYIRPNMICPEPRLAVSPAEETLLYIITGPVGPYFATGFKPVTLMADSRYTRAFPGGAGATKMGANYGPTVYVQQMAADSGCQQVLWLFGPEQRLTEVGTMNLFVFWENKETGKPQLVTPPLGDGLILPGITRSSLLELAAQWNEFDVAEADVTMGDVADALREGRLKEMFGCGTACVVCPIAEIKMLGDTLRIPTMSEGAPVTMRFFQSLTDIQYGRTPDHPWTEVVG